MNFSIAINTHEGDEYRVTLESRKLPDDLNEIPQTIKTIPPQEYRSKLFTLMFARYAELNRLTGITDTPIHIKTIAEDAYVHLISRNDDLQIVDDLKDDILYHYSK